VLCGGNFYMLPVTNSRGKYISVLDLESQLEWIMADAKHSDGENCLHHVYLCCLIKINKFIAAVPRQINYQQAIKNVVLLLGAQINRVFS